MHVLNNDDGQTEKKILWSFWCSVSGGENSPPSRKNPPRAPMAKAIEVVTVAAALVTALVTSEMGAVAAVVAPCRAG